MKIVDENNELIIEKGHLSGSNILELTEILKYTYKNKAQKIGQVRIVATLDFVYQRLYGRVLFTLLTQSIKTFLVSFFIIYLVWLLIARHLDTIKRFVLNLDINDNTHELKLDRRLNHWTENDELSQVTLAINFMLKKLKESFTEIEHLSLHDPLTRLPNRRLMEDRLKHHLAQSEREKKYGAILFIDLDHFKNLNDSLGHTIGDKILTEVAKRLLSAIRKGDTVARIGGDEFVILLSMLSDNSSEASREAKNVSHKVNTVNSYHKCMT